MNYVNAAAVAKETGLAIEVAFSERDPKGYLNGLTVEFEIEGVLNGRRSMTGDAPLQGIFQERSRFRSSADR